MARGLILYFYLAIFCCNSMLATKLSYHPKTILKGSTVTLTCESEKSQPENVTYAWLKDSQPISNVTTSEWIIQTSSLVTRGNYTCLIQNPDGSTCQSATAFLNITAQPSFIKMLPPYYGVLYSNQNVSLTCRIECYPLCSIIWYKNGSRINPDNPLYYVKNQFLPADIRTNDFESVESTLVWILTNWPNQVLDKYSSPVEYTCASQSNGQDLNSTVFMAAEFPPENMTISIGSVVDVMENEPVGYVECTGEGRPQVDYIWIDKSTGSVERRDSTIYVDQLSKFGKHCYICEGFNRHGTKTAEVHFNVLYSPSCSIELGVFNGETALVCNADANPKQVNFAWKLNSLDVINNTIVDERNRSYLVLTSNRSEISTYHCFVNNSVGVGTPCEMVVPAGLFRIELSGMSSEVVAGMTLWLKCEVEATFKVEISWYNNSIFLANNDKVTATIYSQSKSGIFTTTSFLIFVTTRWDNRRTFQCSATNSVKEYDKIPPLEIELHLEVLYPPAVTLSSTETTLKEDENLSVVFFCRYDSNPGTLLGINWYKDGYPLTEIEGKLKYKTDTLDDLSLTITNITREDMGEYSCRLQNDVGEEASQNVFLDVLYRPSVKVEAKTSLQETPLKIGNITLTCKVTSGNPPSLLGSRWFVSGVPLEQYIVLNHGQENKKGFARFLQDSSILTLIEVDENFLEYFTCQGLNLAGLGSQSIPEKVQFFYSNIPTRLVQIPSKVLKGQKVDLYCLVDNVDPSDDVTYFWFKDGQNTYQGKTPKWTIQHASVDLRKNIISCIVTNGRRTSIWEYISVKVVAPPTFLYKPDLYMGVQSTQSVELKCRIECEPLCSILWTVHGNLIESNSSLYSINSVHRTYGSYGFEGIDSTLTFSASHLKQGGFFPFSCASVSPKTYGPDVTATVLLTVY